MTLEQCYQTLEVATGASLTECEESYRRLVRVWHPDRFPSDPALQQAAEEKLKRINLAMDGLRAHFHNESTEDSADTGSNDQAAMYQDRAYLRGGDPRFAAIGPMELLSGGRPATVEVTAAGIVIATIQNDSIRDAVTYLPEFIKGLAHSPDSSDLTLIIADPEGISPQGFRVVLRFKTWYFSALFAKRCRAYLQISPAQTGHQASDKRAAQQPTLAAESTSELVLFGAFVLTVSAVITVVLIGFSRAG